MVRATTALVMVTMALVALVPGPSRAADVESSRLLRGQLHLTADADADAGTSHSVGVDYKCCKCKFPKANSDSLQTYCSVQVVRQKSFLGIGKKAGSMTCSKACTSVGAVSMGVKDKAACSASTQDWAATTCSTALGRRGPLKLSEVIDDEYCDEGDGHYRHHDHGDRDEDGCHWENAFRTNVLKRLTDVEADSLPTSPQGTAFRKRLNAKYNPMVLKAGSKLYTATKVEFGVKANTFLPTVGPSGVRFFSIDRAHSFSLHDGKMTMIYTLNSDITVLFVPRTSDEGAYGNTFVPKIAAAGVHAYASCLECEVVLAEAVFNHLT